MADVSSIVVQLPSFDTADNPLTTIDQNVNVSPSGNIILYTTVFPGTSNIKWIDTAGNTVATLAGAEDTATNGTPALYIETYATTASGSTSYLVCQANNSDSTAYGEFQVNSAGVFQVDLRAGSGHGDSSQAIDLMVKSYTTNTVYTAFYLDAYNNGTAAAGFGIGQVFRAHSASGTMREQAAIYTKWNVATDASRVGEFVIATDTSSGQTIVFNAIPTNATIPILLTLGGNLASNKTGSDTTIDITRNADALGGIRMAAGAIQAQPTGAVFQMWGNSSSFPGQLYFDSGAHNSAGIYFRTSPASTNTAQRLLIDANGNVIVGTAAIATTATDGFLYVTSSAGAPTGTPTAYTGRIPIEIDTTNGKLWAYYGAAWHFAALT